MGDDKSDNKTVVVVDFELQLMCRLVVDPETGRVVGEQILAAHLNVPEDNPPELNEMLKSNAEKLAVHALRMASVNFQMNSDARQKLLDGTLAELLAIREVTK